MKGIAGFYYVNTEHGIYECKARGIFRKDGITPYVGDAVTITAVSEGEAVIETILPRKNEFIRPPVANVDLFVVVAAVKKPKPNLAILDRFLVMAEQHHTEIVLCLHKADLATEQEIMALHEIYGALYPVVQTSSITGEGIAALTDLLKGKTAALAGPSGVGKSTLVNLLVGEGSAEIGEIGNKSKRGKHTTRHVELFDPGYGGLLFDTPGFTSFDVLDAKIDQLAFFYPEMQRYLGQCRYDNCRHLSEPACAVTEAVTAGIIHSSRYTSYCEQMKELQETRKY